VRALLGAHVCCVHALTHHRTLPPAAVPQLEPASVTSYTRGYASCSVSSTDAAIRLCAAAARTSAGTSLPVPLQHTM
jgi:hypothetical protein